MAKNLYEFSLHKNQGTLLEGSVRPFLVHFRFKLALYFEIETRPSRPVKRTNEQSKSVSQQISLNK